MIGPTGRVVIVFTDVESSTELWQRDPEGFRVALARHDAILRAAIARHGGYEVKTMGDAFMVVFDEPLAALGFCMDGQRALRSEPWALPGPLAVRMGAHIGEAHPVPDPVSGRQDYIGPEVNKAARLCYAANGGQVLFSGELREALVPALEFVDGDIVDLGEHLLKGLEGRHRIFQAGTGSFRRLRTPQLRRSNLPARADSFVGRDEEREQLRAWITSGSRVVTLTGPGGTGKTRLALSFAAEALGEDFEQVWWVDLSEARVADDVLRATAEALDLRPGSDPQVQLAHALIGRGRALFVFDNLEQVVAEAAPILSAWVSRAANASFLLTSRVPCQIPGERALPVSPLPERDAVALFFDRAPAPGEDTEAVLALVAALDRLPLAIELAAARTRMLGPRALLERISERFRILRSNRKDRPARHQTLQDCLEWSWDLLGPAEQVALSKLGIFEGSFTLEAAEAVLGEDALEHVSLLVDHSLVRREQDRLGMLLSVRRFALACLVGADLQEAERAHYRYFARYGTDEALIALSEQSGPERLRALASDYENLVAAGRAALADQEMELAARIALVVGELYELRGSLGDGLGLIRTVLEKQTLHRMLRVRLLQRYTSVCRLMGQLDAAREALGQALPLAREQGDRRAEGLLLAELARVTREDATLDEARVLFEQAVAVHREVGNVRAEGTALGELGSVAMAQGRFADARDLLEEALRKNRQTGDLGSEGVTLGLLGNLAFRQGDPTLARERFLGSIRVHREVGNRRAEGVILGNLGIVHRELGERAAAREALEIALELHREVGNRRSEGVVLGSIGALMEEEGDAASARAFLEASIAIHVEGGHRSQESVERGRLGMLLLDEGRPDRARGELVQALDLARAVGDVPGQTLQLARLALLALIEGDRAEAVKLEQRCNVMLHGDRRDAELSRLLRRVAEGLARPAITRTARDG